MTMTVAVKKKIKKKLSKTPEAKEKRFLRLKEKRKRQKESKKEEKSTENGSPAKKKLPLVKENDDQVNAAKATTRKVMPPF